MEDRELRPSAFNYETFDTPTELENTTAPEHPLG